jgi:hypothetical protein
MVWLTQRIDQQCNGPEVVLHGWFLIVCTVN